MTRRFAVSVLLWGAFIPTALLAQQRGSVEGRYTTVTILTDTIFSPDGTATVHFNYKQVNFTDDLDNPFNHVGADCKGTGLLSEEGIPTEAGGSCYGQDAEGDGYWIWWQLEEAGTEDCPLGCFSFGCFEGFGKFEGLSLDGTGKVLVAFLDGVNIGTFTGTYEMNGGR